MFRLMSNRLTVLQVKCIYCCYSENLKKEHDIHQGTNARKVISEVYTFFALQCTVFGRKSKHKRDVKA